MSLEAVVNAPQTEHKATIIWLHGLGDSGDGFAPIVPELKLPSELGVKFVFPHAPINLSPLMAAWRCVHGMTLPR